ncbi:MAG: hypothetical protein ACXVAX_08315 [Pseudobdellovibrio sp.]
MILSLEFYFLKQKPKYSVLLFLQAKNIIAQKHSITTAPGKILSLWLGWIGLGIMIIMNLYSMRKRFKFMHGMGKLSSWLDFHILCGIIGPTFILFHSDFKVHGLVAISFWSMVVSLTSGIVGRYFYVQLLKAKVDLDNEADRVVQALDRAIIKLKVITNEKEKKFALNNALQFAGVPSNASSIGALNALWLSFVGDVKFAVGNMPLPNGWPHASGVLLRQYALFKRRSIFLDSFQKLMGYWHAFHFPFAIFMYIVAAIHVAAALVLGV